MTKLKDKEWEKSNSTLSKISLGNVTYEECRDYSCLDIISNLTHIKNKEVPFIFEIPKGTPYCFLGRVDTNGVLAYDVDMYYDTFKKREFVSFSTYNNRNISYYKSHGNKVILIYELPKEAIVHVFPCDSDTKKDAMTEEELTDIPSLWLTLDELNNLALELKTYPQITGRTKIDGKIIKPVAVLAINELDEKSKEVAKSFNIGCVIVHPDDDAINNCEDLYYNYFKTKKISEKLQDKYDISILHHYYLD